MCMSIKTTHANISMSNFTLNAHTCMRTQKVAVQVIESKWGIVISIKGLSGSQGSLLPPTGSDLAKHTLVY